MQAYSLTEVRASMFRCRPCCDSHAHVTRVRASLFAGHAVTGHAVTAAGHAVTAMRVSHATCAL